MKKIILIHISNLLFGTQYIMYYEMINSNEESFKKKNFNHIIVSDF